MNNYGPCDYCGTSSEHVDVIMDGSWPELGQNFCRECISSLIGAAPVDAHGRESQHRGDAQNE